MFGDVRDLETAKRLLALQTDGRQSYLTLVFSIEFYRRGQLTEAQAIHVVEDDDHWDPIFLALGIAGRAPWSIYPYPDY